jgi:hypothetical protein
MFKRMLSMSLGLALLAWIPGTAVGFSTDKAADARETHFAPDQPARPGPATVYIYKTETQALSAAQFYRSKGKIVEGPYEILGEWHILVSEPVGN